MISSTLPPGRNPDDPELLALNDTEELRRNPSRPVPRRDTFWSNPDLLESGAPHPQAAARNKIKYGFTCPREEYVQSPQVPSLRQQSKTWSVGQSTLKHWRHDQKWPAERERFWNRVEQLKQEILQGDLANLRAKHITGQLGFWEQLEGVLLATLERGTIEEMSPTGRMRERSFGPKDLKDVAQAYAMIAQNANLALGFSKAMLKDESVDDGPPQRITEITYRRVERGPAPTTPNPQLANPENNSFPAPELAAALPAGLLPTDVPSRVPEPAGAIIDAIPEESPR